MVMKQKSKETYYEYVQKQWETNLIKI